jgi:hypothetical protein
MINWLIILKMNKKLLGKRAHKEETKGSATQARTIKRMMMELG